MTPCDDMKIGTDSGRATGVSRRAAFVGFGADVFPRESRRSFPALSTDKHLEKKD